MNDTTKIMHILAFYLSKFDMDAVHKLNYSSRAEAFEKLSLLFNRNDNYLKLRRDEYDVLTASHRNGWRNRAPAKSVAAINEHLQQFTFDELTVLVQSFIDNTEQSTNNALQAVKTDPSVKKIDAGFSENEIEQIINYEELAANLLIVSGNVPRRIYQRSIIDQLKKLYHYICQICGYSFESSYGKKYAEAHHIDFFATTHNNNASNIIILCPNHHRIIHLLTPNFNKRSLTWTYRNGLIELLLHNIHL